jgi:hypothetical protein
MKKILKKLLIEIDNMSIKEYNNYHKKAQKMNKSKIFVKNNIEKIIDKNLKI